MEATLDETRSGVHLPAGNHHYALVLLIGMARLMTKYWSRKMMLNNLLCLRVVILVWALVLPGGALRAQDITGGADTESDLVGGAGVTVDPPANKRHHKRSSNTGASSRSRSTPSREDTADRDAKGTSRDKTARNVQSGEQTSRREVKETPRARLVAARPVTRKKRPADRTRREVARNTPEPTRPTPQPVKTAADYNDEGDDYFDSGNYEKAVEA